MSAWPTSIAAAPSAIRAETLVSMGSRTGMRSGWTVAASARRSLAARPAALTAEDLAESIRWVSVLPSHVNINHIELNHILSGK